MKNFNDKELNRILSEADQLLSDIHLYETPEEEQRRKQKEEEARQQEELKRLAEEEKQRELERQEKLQQEELKRLAEEEKQNELEQQEQLQSEPLVKEEKQKELEKQEQLQQEDSELLAEQEKSKVLEEQEQTKQEVEQLSEEVELPKQPLQTSGVGFAFFPVLFLVGSFIYMELLTHLSLYRSIDSTILYPVLWAVGLGCLSAMIVSLFPRKVNRVLVVILLVLGGLYCDLQIFCHDVTGSFFNLTAISESIQRMSQLDEITPVAFFGILWLIGMFLPAIFWMFLGREYLAFEKGNWRNRLILLFSGVIFMSLMVLSLDIHGYEADSPYVCFYQFDSTKNLELAGKQLGMGTMIVLELLECLH